MYIIPEDNPESTANQLGLFKSPKNEKIPTAIIRQIRTLIMQGKLVPGQALPNEKELIKKFNVSKHTLREALRTLEWLGLISIKLGAGGGPVVREIDFDNAREYFTSFLHFQRVSRADLFEMRKLTEPYIARRVAETLTDETMNALEGIHENCREILEAGENLVGAEAEILFHVCLAKHTNNSVLWMLMDFVNNILADIKTEIKPGLDFSHKVMDAHQKIIDAIKARDPDGAELAMKYHIYEVASELDALAAKKLIPPVHEPRNFGENGE
ncbi:MAG: FadR family transcriptional regulator [Deltaproteobacteria bacterium]|jgi:GntR family transcriptional repressor for pyruvate dehydrogenase complex|nr:FadR family transcriptional regulator [Deltaproteobacteria bacterium]